MSTVPYIGEILSVGAAVFWAVGVVLFKQAGLAMPPTTLNFFKNCFAMILMPITMWVLNEPFFPQIPTRWWLLMALSGFMGIALADTMFFFSLQKLGAGLTAVVDVSYTPLMLVMSFFVLNEDIANTSLIGALLIVVALLIGSFAKPEKEQSRRDIVQGIMVGVLGIALMVVSIIMIKDVLNSVPTVWAATVRVSAGVLGLLPLMLLSPDRLKIWKALKPSKTWTKAILGSFFGTYLAMTAWIGGLKFTQVHRAALLNQLSTIFIFILAIVFLKESLTLRKLTAVFLAFTGALLVIY